MGDPIRHVSQQELPAAAHADAADHEHVRLLPLGGLDDRLGRILAEHDSGAPPLAGQAFGVLGQLACGLGAGAVVREQHAKDEQLGVIALGHLGREAHRALCGLRTVGRHQHAANREPVVALAAQAH